MIGKTLVHYEITSLLGKGGMGEVYQAKDTKLGRDVAIKVLPDELAWDIDRVARFQREAKFLAALNHPNIAAIYGLEQADGIHFLVMELIEGDTLADRIKTGPVPVEEALKLAQQIAEALEAAHEKGVIHRDLKPANIKVTPDGKVKILDFGLAKAFAEAPADQDPKNSPTLSDIATRQGIILGTSAYMPPEQAKGKSVDKRADIWAFGVVLFEMLSGQQLFTGETVSETMASVLKSEPEWQRLPSNLHPRIRMLLERCLEKETRNRYSGISDARVDIDKTLADPGGLYAQPAAAAGPAMKSRQMAIWASITLILIILAGIFIWRMREPKPPTVMRFAYDIPGDQQFLTLARNYNLPVLAVSPDGEYFVYSTMNGLYLRYVGELSAKLIAGTEGPTMQPFFSPDGKMIAYISVQDRKFKKISINGGAPVNICDTPSIPVGGCWENETTILFGQTGGPVMRVSANGGTPEPVTGAKSKDHLFPQVLPGGEYLMYTADVDNPRVLVMSLKSGKARELFSGYDAQYLPTGHIIYRLRDNNNLYAVPFDLDSLESTGNAVPMVEGITQSAVSSAGTLVCIPGTSFISSPAGFTLAWVDLKGKETPLGVPPRLYLFPRISPDGKQVVMTIADDNSDIWIWNLERKTMTRLTFDKSKDYQPIWTPDSRHVLFWSAREGDFGAIFRKRADGTGSIEKLVANPERQLFPWDITKDGKTIVVVDTPDPEAEAHISILSTEEEFKLTPLLHHKEYFETQVKISPDGKWVAYVSGESGNNETYVRSFPEIEKGRWQISTNGGVSPLWAPDGHELYYFSGNDDVMAVRVETGETFRAGTPRKLFSRAPYFGGGSTPGTPWDIYPDGTRFLMTKLPSIGNDESNGITTRKIYIFLNWFEELKQRAPENK